MNAALTEEQAEQYLQDLGADTLRSPEPGGCFCRAFWILRPQGAWSDRTLYLYSHQSFAEVLQFFEENDGAAHLGSRRAGRPCPNACKMCKDGRRAQKEAREHDEELRARRAPAVSAE